jgi:hypothetical protein
MDPIAILMGILIASWDVCVEAGVFLLFGFLAAGIIYVLIPRDKVLLHLGESSLTSVLKASLFGVPLPLCSCGVIPAVAELRNKGASKSASLAFLISVPETGVDSIALSWTLLDPVLTIARPVVAFVTATITGLVSNAVDPEEVHEVSTDETCIHCGDCLLCNPHDHTITEKVRSAFEYGFGELLGDLAPSLAVGIILAGVIAYLVPEDVLGAYIGSGFHSLVIMLLVGIPLYICATSSTPVVASLIAKGMSPGAGLVFLLAGPTTNMATIAVVRSRFGTRSVVIYLTSIAICSLGAGMLVDGYYTSAGLDPRTTIGNAGELFPHNVEVGAAIVLIILLARGVYLQYTKGPPCDDVCCSTEVKPTCTHDTDDANDHHEKGSCEHDHEGHEH